jgi:mannitol/fructose-specific phosphotransferase system IIA component (Ntr-type)
MTNAAFPGDPDRNTEAYRLLLTSATSYPVELAAGAVLLHGHCDHINEPILIIGAGDGDWEFANTQTPPRILLALLSPTSQPPSRHLKSLADLARRFLKPQFAAEIASARSAADIQTLIESPTDE